MPIAVDAAEDESLLFSQMRCPGWCTPSYGGSPFQPAARNCSSGTISRVAMTGRGEVPTRDSPMMLSSSYESDVKQITGCRTIWAQGQSGPLGLRLHGSGCYVTHSVTVGEI